MELEEHGPGGRGHRILLEERERLSISGVEEVERFDEESIRLTIAGGGLEIQGAGLHIEQLSLDGGDLRVQGQVHALIYDGEQEVRGGGLFSRLFGA